MNSLAFDTAALSLREAFAMLAERLERRELLGDDQRRVVGQHHAA